VKVDYNESNATIKQDEYGFTFVNFSSLIPISNQSFVFPIHVEQVFFSSCDSRERGWKVVLQKDLCGQWITKHIQIDHIKFDIFKVGNIDEYLGLAALVSIQDIIQPTTIVGGCNVSGANLLIDNNNGAEDDESDNPKYDASSSSNVW